MKTYCLKGNINDNGINRDILEDVNLSWTAKGLWHHAFNKFHDREFCAFDLLPCGTDTATSMKSGLKELEENGYLSIF